jgi:putative MATE family efflux protein
MKDMTKGPVHGHVLQLSAFIALTTLFQTLYFLVDLYFVGRLGKEAIAGVALAGSVMMIVLGLTQTLGVGATSLIAQAIGRKDRRHAELMFNQAMGLSLLIGFAFGVVMFSLRHAYAAWLAADPLTSAFGTQYLNWFIPAMALQFALVAMGAALRALGDMKVPTMIQVTTILVNIVLAPVLMFGWGTGWVLGVAGAALASFIAIGVGCVAFTLYFRRAASHLQFVLADWRPQPALWGKMLKVGLPVGGEFALISVYLTLVYDILRPFGSAAQAGFGIGGRIMQALFLPAVAIGFATAPVVGQNFGARLGTRVRQSFYSAAMMSAGLMIAFTILCQFEAEAMVRVFVANGDANVIAFGAEYLRTISWVFLASGVIFVSSSVFQGMGNTLPALGSSLLRLLIFAVPAYLLAQRPNFQMRYVWYLSVASVVVQMCVSVWLLHREFNRKLVFEAS